ncbi:hypothetical protein FB45DRAFT_899579 [Roridomyces roridus]|uniref:Uncharacterized protein n=1 Tax=Roridomyces roridus TaxID=1738132 RepID=A0AAD7C7A1_9AGAR|nr:hypothetical protein FB45DRAFT_899579 [Roridomyces roridus]
MPPSPSISSRLLPSPTAMALPTFWLGLAQLVTPQWSDASMQLPKLPLEDSKKRSLRHYLPCGPTCPRSSPPTLAFL